MDSSIIGSSLFSAAFILFLQHFSLLQQCSFDTIFLSYGSRDLTHMGRNSQVLSFLGRKVGLLFWTTLTTAINTINTTTSPNTTQNGILKRMNIFKKVILCCLKIKAVNLQSGHRESKHDKWNSKKHTNYVDDREPPIFGRCFA